MARKIKVHKIASIAGNLKLKKEVDVIDAIEAKAGSIIVVKALEESPDAFPALMQSLERSGVTLPQFSEAFIATGSSAPPRVCRAMARIGATSVVNACLSVARAMSVSLRP